MAQENIFCVIKILALPPVCGQSYPMREQYDLQSRSKVEIHFLTGITGTRTHFVTKKHS